MPFDFTRLELPEVVLIKPSVFGDNRGFFTETYKQTDFFKFGITDNFVQDNHSRSVRSVLRGLHYQKLPYAQAKLVRCTKGEIYDFAVDIRRGSPTFGRWVGVTLSEENRDMLYVPAGFAHGFVVISECADVLYKASSEYSPEHDRGILWSDPAIGITVNITDPIVSEKDKSLPLLENGDNNFVYEGIK